MATDDAARRTRILFAETRALKPDAANPNGLKTIRDSLAALIRDSNDGIGFAPADEPTMDDLGQPLTLAAWQEAASAAANPLATPQVGGQAANVAIFAKGDPLQDATFAQAYPWLAQIPAPPQAFGRAKLGNLDVGLFLATAPAGVSSGRYPRDGQYGAVVEAARESFQLGFPNRILGAICFIAALLVMILPAVWVGYSARVAPPTEAGAVANVNAFEATYATAKVAVETAVKADAQSPTPATATAVATARQALQTATEDLAKAKGGYRNVALQWAVATLGLFALLATISFGLRREILGFLVDERGRMSLARFQFVAWMLTILGAYWIASAWNIGVGVEGGEADIQLPQMSMDLWILLGITTASPLMSALILNVKAGPTTKGASGADAAGGQTGENKPPQAPSNAVSERGVLDVRTKPWTWSFLDLFTGEEITNRASVDVSRVQQFVFTLVALLAYIALLATMFHKLLPDAPIVAMPDISPYLVGLLAISHSGYLAAKALPK